MTDADVARLLTAAGVPAGYAAGVVAALGTDAGLVLRENPWRLLDVAGVQPGQADAFARAMLGRRARPNDPRRGTAIACWHLTRAAAGGHTALPAQPLAAAMSASGVPDPAAALAGALAEQTVVAVPADPTAPESPILYALAGLAAEEESLAEGLERLLVTAEPVPDAPFGGSGVTAVVAPYPGAETARRLTAIAEAAYAPHGLRVVRASAHDLAARLGVLAAADVCVLDDAEMLDVPGAAQILAALPDGRRLVLVGDPALLPPRGPGQVLADVIDSGVIPIRQEPPEPDGAAQIAYLVEAVRRGELPAVDDPERAVVVVPAEESTAATRAVQLVTDSIPRALGIPAQDVLVVTPRAEGTTGAAALDAMLRERLGPRDGHWARPVAEAQGIRAAAVVAVFPSEAADALTRPLVATAFGLATRHLSVVAGAGSALREAVAHRTAPPRHTRLAGLLR